ncbi:energy transducer TonB [Azospirillum sp. TSO22-1]|uniref:energy transducer TonB n=1 Tax=Azospirillum sp. TSO22-1 TaxID=716789 RepID=UPI000D65CC72|nr:energy transducer TonB [Azospirillum sp. TSO22-1]
MAFAHDGSTGSPLGGLERAVPFRADGRQGRCDAIAGMLSALLHVAVVTGVLLVPPGERGLPEVPSAVAVDLILELAAPEEAPASEEPPVSADPPAPAPAEATPAPLAESAAEPASAVEQPSAASAEVPMEPVSVEAIVSPSDAAPPPAVLPAEALPAAALLRPPRKPRVAPPTAPQASPRPSPTVSAMPAEPSRPSPEHPAASVIVSVDYAASVSSRLERLKTYPRQARLQRQEGTVLVRFRVDAEGQVVSCAIAGGSGYALLDEEACALVRRASPLPSPPGTSGQGSLELTVPVRFFLN